MIAAAPRLISKIQQRENGCWELDVVVSKNGYVSLGYRDEQGAARRVYAHRLSYILHVGAIPDGMDLDHLCRNRRCCNPSHLEPVTRRENIMRGDGPAILAARNGTKTHCINGHSLNGENLYQRPTGGRACKQCRREAGMRSRQRALRDKRSPEEIRRVAD